MSLNKMATVYLSQMHTINVRFRVLVLWTLLSLNNCRRSLSTLHANLLPVQEHDTRSGCKAALSAPIKQNVEKPTVFAFLKRVSSAYFQWVL